MKILTGYDGSSIQILDNNEESNTVTVSPKEENGTYSNYYNFKVKNGTSRIGTLYIKNLNKTLYNQDSIPYYSEGESNYKRISDDRIIKLSDGIQILVNVDEEFEVSSYPRYVEENLDKFICNNKSNLLTINNGVLKEITIGDTSKKTIVIIGRQHPGETLSSFFIEGIISEIINNYDNYKDLSFIIFPIVNTKGVKEGNHRYTDNIDYNRSWQLNGISKEIDYIKSVLEKHNIQCFIDVHCDEVSSVDYIRTKSSLIDDFDDVKVIKDPSVLRRFLRALIKQKKIIKLSQKTAREYVKKECDCDNMLVELSLNNNDQNTSKQKGKDFIKSFKG